MEEFPEQLRNQFIYQIEFSLRTQVGKQLEKFLYRKLWNQFIRQLPNMSIIQNQLSRYLREEGEANGRIS